MEYTIDKVPLEIAVGDIENYVADETVTDNISFMQTKIYLQTAKILKGVIDVVSAENTDMELQKFHIPTTWIMTVLSDINQEGVRLQELFPSEWINVVAGIVHHELYAEHTGVTTEIERRKIIYGIVGEMTGTANITVHEVMSMWLGYASEWETDRAEVLKVVKVLAGPETAPNTPGDMEAVTFASERISLDLGIPTPLELLDLRAALGYEATLEELLTEYRANYEKYSLSIDKSGSEEPTEITSETTTEATTTDNVEPSPLVTTETTSEGKDGSVLDTMLEDAERIHRETVRRYDETATRSAEQINNAGLNVSEIEAKIEAKIEGLNAATPAYYGGGGGGGSSEWTTGEIILTGAAVLAVGAALWYGYNSLTSNDYDINLSDFEVPDFDMPDFDF